MCGTNNGGCATWHINKLKTDPTPRAPRPVVERVDDGKEAF